MANALAGVDSQKRPIWAKNRGTMRCMFTLDSVGDSPALDLSDFRDITFLIRAATGTPVFNMDIFDYDGAAKQGKHNGSAITALGPQGFITPIDQVVLTLNSLSGGTLSVEVRCK